MYTSELKRRNIYYENQEPQVISMSRSPIYKQNLMSRINDRSLSKVKHGREMKQYNLKTGGEIITNQLRKHEKSLQKDLRVLKRSLRERLMSP